MGRCADYVLESMEGLVRIFIYADMDFREKRTIEKKEYYAAKDAKKNIKRIDRERRDYFRYYTGKEWESPDNYDLMINTAAVGINGAVETIKIILRPVDFRFKKHLMISSLSFFFRSVIRKNTFSYTGNDGIKRRHFYGKRTGFLSRGSLKIQVINIRNNFPIQNAKVSISSKGEPERVLEQLTTDSSGQTENISLPAPPEEYSLEPSIYQPYSEYNVLGGSRRFFNL